MSYHLVFVLRWIDARLPLVQSQTFDQAELQTTLSGENKPLSVSVWILTPLRHLLNSSDRNFINKIRQRCPSIKIHIIPGINRLQDFPYGFLLRSGRRQFGMHPVIFHFRGESALNIFSRHYKSQQKDYRVLDVRGYWPAELLYSKGIEDVGQVTNDLVPVYEKTKRQLQEALDQSDAIVTVSENLKKLLHGLAPTKGQIQVIPCCVKAENDGAKRKYYRQRMCIGEDEKLLVYSGGYARYQHLEDLTLPFLTLLMELSPRTKVLILSHAEEKIKAILPDMDNSIRERFIFIRAEQEEVSGYLSACDLGFLLRKETLVNKVAQPVKLGEYLAAGVPVCVEGEVGGVTERIKEYEAGLSIHIDGQDENQWRTAAEQVLKFLFSGQDNRHFAKQLAEDYFLWPKNITRQRNFYRTLLSGE